MCKELGMSAIRCSLHGRQIHSHGDGQEWRRREKVCPILRAHAQIVGCDITPFIIAASRYSAAILTE